MPPPRGTAAVGSAGLGSEGALSSVVHHWAVGKDLPRGRSCQPWQDTAGKVSWRPSARFPLGIRVLAWAKGRTDGFSSGGTDAFCPCQGHSQPWRWPGTGVGFVQDKESPVSSALCATGDGKSQRERKHSPQESLCVHGGHLETPGTPGRDPELPTAQSGGTSPGEGAL